MFDLASSKPKCRSCSGETSSGQSPLAQPKLKVSRPNDALEQEADRVAEAVLRGDGSNDVPLIGSSTKTVQRLCAECAEEEQQENEEGGVVFTKSHSSSGAEVTPPALSKLNALQGPGRALPNPDRSFFESRFGHDFSQVRIHCDGKSAEAARSLNAKGYTVGRDIVLDPAYYVPGTFSGNHLLAHELTHVVQQSASSGSHASPGSLNPPTVQRQCLTGSVCGELEEPEETEAEADVPTTEPVRAVTGGISGSPGSFGEDLAEAMDEERERREREEPEDTGQGRRAAFIERYARAEGFSLDAIHGIFVDKNIGRAAGAYRQRCGAFDEFSEPFTGDSNASCLFFPERREIQAQEYLEHPDQATIGGTSRASWRLRMNVILTHEIQHAVFNASTRPDSPEGRCSLTTIVYRGLDRREYDVHHLLSELSAILSEFTVNYRTRRPYTLEGMDAWLNRVVHRSGESIGGILTNLRCVCDCSEVDEYVIQTEEFTTDSWSETERAYLNAGLRRQPDLNWPVEPDEESLTTLRALLETRQPGRTHTWSLRVPDLTLGYGRHRGEHSLIARAGIDFGVPLDEMRRWTASVGLHETVIQSGNYLSFLSGVRAGLSWITPGGSGHSFRLGAFGELGGAAMQDPTLGVRSEFHPDIYSQAGVSLGYTPPAIPGSRLHFGVDVLGGSTFGVGEATATPWFGLGVRFGVEFFGSRD